MTLFYLGAFAASLLLSFVGTWFVREFAKEHGWVAGPVQDRHLHNAPLPRLGGVAIFLAFALSFGTVLLLALRSPAVNVRSLRYVKLHEQGAAAVEPVAALLADENPYIRARAVWLLADLGAEGTARAPSPSWTRAPVSSTPHANTPRGL